MVNPFKTDPWYYIQGTYRQVMYNISPKLLRRHIVEQYLYRINKAQRCFKNGSCIVCGCTTPDLFFANKSCSVEKYPENIRLDFYSRSNNCYQEMMTKKDWNKFKTDFNLKFL